jgi:hypothetical protein
MVVTTIIVEMMMVVALITFSLEIKNTMLSAIIIVTSRTLTRKFSMIVYKENKLYI